MQKFFCSILASFVLTNALLGCAAKKEPIDPKVQAEEAKRLDKQVRDGESGL